MTETYTPHYKDTRSDAERQAEKIRLDMEEIDRLPNEILNRLDDLAGWLEEYGWATELIPQIERAAAIMALVRDALSEPDLD
jgi:hypothetical protein